MINSTIKGKYGLFLKFFHRITSLLKSYETNIKHRAEIFYTTEVQMFLYNKAQSWDYWLVMKVVLDLVLFGGLRYCESMHLVL